MSFSIKKQAEVVVVDVEGQLIVGNRQELKQKVLDELETEGRVIFRYADANGTLSADANPNGSERNIAGIISDGGNVLGLMPHPERACSPLLGSNDGVRLFESILSRVAA